MLLRGHTLISVAVLYLKNTIMAHWKEEEGEVTEGENAFCLDEQSKAVIRENIVGAIIQSPLIIRYVRRTFVQLVCKLFICLLLFLGGWGCLHI